MAARALLLGLAAACALAQFPEPPPQVRNVRIPRVEHPPALEDFLNGHTPAGLAPISDFRQYQPADGKPVSRPTEAYLAYDESRLYAVFRCREDPAKVRARLSRREDIFSDDTVALYLDTFHDRQHVYAFYVNPLGVQADSIATEGQSDDYAYDTLWQSQGRVTSEGYIVWMAIPFRSLRFRNSDVQTWGIGLARNIPAVNESSYWPYYTARVEGFAQQLGTAEGLENLSRGRNLQFIPYGAASRARYLEDSGPRPPAFRERNEVRGGIDSKVIVRDAVTLDFTVNPDFSQVESDDPQVTVNQRFEVFFPEKRPFFLDNAGYFVTPENLFFSRRIVNPEFGARMTAKSGKWLAGLLAIDDRAPGAQLAEDDPHFGERALALVGRAQRQIGRQSTVGAIFTRYTFGSGSQSVGGFDTRLKLLPNLVFTAQAARSQLRPGDGTPREGAAYFADLAYSGLHFTSQTTYRDRSPEFTAALGYIPRVDIRQIEEDMQYRWRPAGSLLKSWGPGLRLLGNQDRQGRIQDWSLSPVFTLEFTGQTNLTLGRTESLELYRNLRFRKHSTDIAFASEFFRFAAIQVTYGAGARVNYDPTLGMLPFVAGGRDLSAKLTLRPTSRMKFDQTYLFSRLGTLESIAIFNNHSLRSTMNYQFTRALSLRAILDYNGVLPNPSLTGIERTKRVTADLLLTYLLHPGTAVYVGYTDRRENLALLPGVPPQLQRTAEPDTVTGRQFFAKVSYLFRF